jgi:hypothetical protein
MIVVGSWSVAAPEDTKHYWLNITYGSACEVNIELEKGRTS